MNYENFIQNTIQYPLPNLSVGENTIYCFFSNGTGASFSYDGLDANTQVLELMYYVANKCNRDYTNRTLMACQVFSYRQEGNYYESELLMTNKLDFVQVEGTFMFQGRRYDDIENDTLFESVAHNNYYLGGNSVNFTEYSYGTYSGLVSNSKAIYDITNYKYEDGYDYRTDVVAIRGENMAFYTHTLVSFNYSSSTPFAKFSYGSPISTIANSEYERGYNGGYNTGWVEGQKYGYEQGVNSGIDGNTHTALNYITQAFQPIETIMSLEVLPHITLGLVFSIPMVLVAIMVIFRIVKK